MKKTITILCGIIMIFFHTYSQIYFENIAVNNVSITPVTSNGYIGFYGNLMGGYYVPKNAGTRAGFASALWMGGLDGGGQLHLAAQTYAQTGNDFTYGPYPSSSGGFQWNKVWKIRKSMVDSFKLNLYSSVPTEIAQWPGNGNTSSGQSAQLAPFKDINNNGIYEPNLGEYPCIKGDEALYAIYNDDITHGETGGTPLGIEVHQMIYGFNFPNDSAAWNTVFFNYRIINRSNNTYNPFYVTWWNDIDIGYYLDDFIGTDVERNAIYGYNADSYDESISGLTGFGSKVPASGYVFLDLPPATPNDGIDNNKNCVIDEPNETVGMAFSMSYNNNLGSFPPATTNPTTSVNYWNYMRSLWKDNTPLKRINSGYDTANLAPYKYIFPDSSDNQYGWGAGGNCSAPVTFTNSWDEISIGNTAGDRRILGTIGPVVLPPNGEMCFTMAYVFAQDSSHPNDNVYAVRLFKHRVDQIQNFFNANQLGGCGCYLFTGINEISSAVEKIYPNPSQNFLHIRTNNSHKIHSVKIMDVSGKYFSTPSQYLNDEIILNVSDLNAGYYIVEVLHDHQQKNHYPIIIQK